MMDILIPYLWRRNSKNHHPIWDSWLMFISKLCCVLNFLGWAWRIEWKLTFCLASRNFLSAKELVQVRLISIDMMLPHLWRRNSRRITQLGIGELMFISKLCGVLNFLGELNVLNGNLLFVQLVGIFVCLRD